MPKENIDKLLRTAITERQLLEVVYHDKKRTVEPHDYGTLNGTAKLLAYQLIVGETTGRPPNWRLMNVDEIESVRVLNKTFPGGRGPFQNPHKWDQLFARVMPSPRNLRRS